jgi:type I restriction enzyme, R subunit
MWFTVATSASESGWPSLSRRRPSLARLYRRLGQSGLRLIGTCLPERDGSVAVSSSGSFETSAERTSAQPTAPDVSERLQRLIAGWRGADRGQPLSALHDECRSAVGPGGAHLLPARVLAVAALDEATLGPAIQRSQGIGPSVDVRFRVRPVGRFDAAMVPVGPVGSPPDRWLLAVDDGLGIADQVALYAHAVGFLLLNREQVQLGRRPALDPRDRFAHYDTLGDLRLVANSRQPADRRVLETYPQLATLLRAPDEAPSIADQSVIELRQRLGEAGWRGHLLEAPYVFTDGRVFVAGSAIRRGQKLRVDALLRADASLPIATVNTLRAGDTREDALRRLSESAHARLSVPFAYLLDNTDRVVEFDWTGGSDPVLSDLATLPSRDQLLQRWLTALGLSDSPSRQTLLTPYRPGAHRLRYYQESAVNRAVIAVLQAQRGLRDPRVLLTLATGTGKTKIAFQLAWKLKQARAIKRLLFVTDRDFLLGQAMDNEFNPFGLARKRIQGEVVTSRDIYFATYQAISDSQGQRGLYRGYPADFFDLVIIDECHRGSAQDESNWRAILDYFSGAVQIGLTATPLRNDNVETYRYFGEPLYSYSLRMGINDGFLAPYRVRRILLGERENEQPGDSAAVVEAEISDGAPQTTEGDQAGAADGTEAGPWPEVESSSVLWANTDVIANHLVRYLRQTDPMAKSIIFCLNQAHADRMRDAIGRAASDLVAQHPGYVERIVSDDGQDGKTALGRFSLPDEKTPVIVTTSRLLATGVDVPTCKNIVLVRPINSMVEFKQIIGRGTRLHEPEKLWFTIVDYAGATRLFFDPEFDGDPELVEIEPLIPRPPVDLPTAEDDGTVDDTSVDETVAAHEGQEAVAPSASAARAADEDHKPGDGVVVQGEASPETMEARISDPAAGQQSTYPSGIQTGAAREDEQPTDGASEAGSPVAGSIVQATNDVTRAPTEQPAVGTDDAGSETGESTSTRIVIRETGAPWVTPAPSESRVVLPLTRAGRRFAVVGEILYELAADGTTLRTVTVYRQYAADAVRGLGIPAVDLRSRWLQKEHRDEIRQRLIEEGVDLAALADVLRMPDADPLDLLLHVAFGEQPQTRRERADRVCRDHADMLSRHGQAAREILETILEKYVDGDIEAVDEPSVLRVPPLSERGTFLELARPFGGGRQVRETLTELQRLLSSA